MARLYANENFPLPVVERLREFGDDVLTTTEAGRHDQALSDEDVLALAISEVRTVLTLNRKHFIRLHAEQAFSKVASERLKNQPPKEFFTRRARDGCYGFSMLSVRNGRKYHSRHQVSAFLTSSAIIMAQGIRYSVMTVAKSTPNASDTAIGMRN